MEDILQVLRDSEKSTDRPRTLELYNGNPIFLVKSKSKFSAYSEWLMALFGHCV